MRRILDAFYAGCMTVAALATVCILITVTAQIFGRLLGIIVPSAPDIAGYSMAASSFMALAYTLREGGHIRVSLLVSNLGRRARRITEGAGLSLALSITTFFTIYLILLVLESHHYGDVSSGIVPIPIWIPQCFLAFGLFALGVALADELVSVVRGRTPGYLENQLDPLEVPNGD